jgi:gamma-glutamylcyclotransferase (GGCT)/AIG2-like uncharacterized protein YtfP
MLPLFAYGTLRDPDFQRELFARTFPMRPALVRDFIVVSTGGGYLAAVPHPGATIAGALVELDAAGYAIADAWEDRTVYDRVEIEARTGDGRPERCWMYVYARPVAGGASVTDRRLTDRTRDEVMADIRAFRASADFPGPR